MGTASRSSRLWFAVPVVVVELLLVVAVIGGVSALHDRHTLASSHVLSATAQVTRTSKSCRGGCVWDSYGTYVVAGQREDDVLLQCCADRPLSGDVRVRLERDSPRQPVLVGSDQTKAIALGAAAAVVLVLSNGLLSWMLLRRRHAR